MFRLIRSLNNNAALVKNEQNEQIVVMGLGITFQKKKGDIINPEKIEKEFVIKNNETRENFLMLLKDVPLDFITITFELIETLTKKYNFTVQNYIFVTLTDHMFAAYKMLKSGSYIASKLPDLSVEYPIENKIAKEALQIFQNKLNVTFPSDEVQRIALHFINAKGDETNVKEALFPNETELLNLVKIKLQEKGIVRNDINSNYYDRLMIHLSYFLNSLDRVDKSNYSILNLKNQIMQEYPTAYKIGEEIYNLISLKTGKELFEGEKLYIVLHIQRLI
ncbi:PRD domain-containing protein [Streptococcus penaeicida]|uniref:PRD domain-containing protein n=1 Tax=Streptococcus penaeicida TaxID=1765960 RepID=UPI0039F024B5